MAEFPHQAALDAARASRPGPTPFTGLIPRQPGPTVHEVRRACRPELTRLTERLIATYRDRLPAGTVILRVAEARESLLRAGVRAGLPVAVASMASLRLEAEATPGAAT